ncbi:MAG: hypothetical protein ACREP6_12095 [Candidatus Binataceae bacterium]
MEHSDDSRRGDSLSRKEPRKNHSEGDWSVEMTANAEIAAIEKNLANSRRDLREATGEIGQKVERTRAYFDAKEWISAHPVLMPILAVSPGFALGFRKNPPSRKDLLAPAARTAVLSGVSWLFWNSIRGK